MILAIVVLLMICESASAQTKTNNSFLWRISGGGLKESSYLVGTFHMMCKKDFEIKPKKEKYFFAIGGGHLSGTNDVIQLLRSEGYTVKPVLN